MNNHQGAVKPLNPRRTFGVGHTLHLVRAVFALSGAALVFGATGTPASAQTQPAANAFDFGARKVTARTNGVRLDGNAYVKSPQLDARADTVAFDFAGKQITEVRAQGNVNFKVNLVPQGGGAPARIEARAANATLDPVKRVLVLSGNVDGFYQMQGGTRGSLKGTRATLSYPSPNDLRVNIEGGTGNVRLEIPSNISGTGTDNFGTVVITARSATASGAAGTITFSGNARAVSNGATKFDVSAPSFTVTRNAQTGTLDNIKTGGRTVLKVNLPQSVAPSTGAGHPTYFEVASDTVTMEAQSNAQLGTLTFSGNVDGSYRLVQPDGTANNFPFKGDRAVINNIGASNPEQFQLEVTGAPVEIQAPIFDLGF